MILVSEEFKKKIEQPRRRVLGMVKIYWSDPYFLKDSTKYTVYSESTLTGCRPHQVLDDSPLRNTDIRKWLHFDGVSRFSDSLYPAPSNIQEAMAERARVGWWSDVRCDAGGTFSPELILEVRHSPKTVFDVLVRGEEAYAEFPLDFKVRLYSSNGAFYVFKVQGNQFSEWRGIVPDDVREQAGKNGEFDFRYVTKMELVISRWSKGNRVAKITTFAAHNEMTFTSDDIFGMDLLEELEVTESELPIGTVSANEIDIRLNNIKDRFYTGNPETDLVNVLLPNRRVKPYLGVQTNDKAYEWVPLGLFWTQGWNLTESSAEVSITARDRLELLRQMRYLGSPVSSNKSLYDLTVEVLESARGKMPDLEYNVDECLKEQIIPTCYLPVADYMQTLSTIAEAGLSRVYADRAGVVQVSGPSRFSRMNPWNLGEYVWVFEDGDELVGAKVQKSFTTAGTHLGMLYVTDPITGQTVSKRVYVEVRDSDIEKPSRVTLSLDDGTAVTTRFDQTDTDPLKYDLRFNVAGAKNYKVTVYSQSGESKAESVLLMEVRAVSIASLFTLEGESGDTTVTQTSPQRYSLRWASSGSKVIRAVTGRRERKFLIEVRPEIEAEWLIHKE